MRNRLAGVRAAIGSGRPYNKAMVAAVAAAVAVALTAGVASAFVQETAHVKSTGGTGTVSLASVKTITASAATISGALYPGGTADLAVTIANPYNNLALTVVGVAAAGTVTTGASGCTTTGVSVVTTPTSISPSSVAAGATTPITLTGAVQMSSAASSGCQGATFTVPLAITVKVG